MRLLATVVATALLLGSCSDGSDPSTADEAAAGDDTIQLFDASVVHDIAVEFDQADYDEMIDAFVESGDKTWIEATVTVDGVTYERAGLRLKGNSSLMGVRQGQDDDADGGDESSESSTSEPADGERPPGPGGGGLPGLGGGADADVPESLPWLIRLDEFVQDQRHQGYADIVVRSSSSTTSLNEAVALDLLEAAGLASQRAISTSFSVNGGDPVLRLAVEHPDDDAWQDGTFSSPGALYKAESTGDWSYRGDDPESYTDVFDQEGGKKVADLTPLIDFLQFINDSDDETFAAELSDRLDVDAFATYLALMDLVENFDDIDGPGNNSYLWWDEESGQFTVVPWDMNLAFGSMGGLGPGGGGPGGPGGPEGFDPEDVPEGFDPEDLPEGFDPEDLPGAAPGGGGGMGGFGRGNVLVERFLANEDLEALYQEELESLRADLIVSGTADSLLDARVETLSTVPDLVDEATLDEEAAAIRDRIAASAAG